MAGPGNKVLSKMLDRLLAGLMSGPNMNCRPHNSRQRVDLTQLKKLHDISGEDILAGLLSEEKCSRIVAKCRVAKKADEDASQQKAWVDQTALLAKLKLIADEARTYENDTGVHALSIGFPLLSLPPGSFAGGARNSSKRILAPIAFIPITVQVKGGSSPAVEMMCRGEGADRVVANTALINWVEQQTGKPQTGKPQTDKPQSPELFEDEEGVDPVREIAGLVDHVAQAMNLHVPAIFSPGGNRVADPGDTTLARIEPESQARLVLQAAPAGDDDTAEPTILLSAVMGLFPTAHQGLIRDTRSMLQMDSALSGPIQNFLSSGIDFDAPVAVPMIEPAVVAAQSAGKPLLAAPADPCQAGAVALARQSAGLVIHGPPGTGKSQTITNIIADHLARGQRVLLVCEKRTALDVVADRLENMGLRNLCGIVHDPQRDQRDLYRSIHQQLDTLPESRTNANAGAALQKVEAELKQLHDELTGYHSALMDGGAEGGVSFHELMGRWMTYRSDYNVRIDAGDISATQLEAGEQAVRDLLRRAVDVDYTKNPWVKCAGMSLGDFLSRPMASIRTVMDRIAAAADAADAAADARILPFTEHAPVMNQAAARAELAEVLVELFPRAVETGLIALAGRDLQAVRQQRGRMDGLKSEIALFRTGPVEGSLTVPQNPKADLLTLEQYLDATRKWTGVFAFGVKSAAAGVLQQQGLTLSAENAERVKAFVLKVEARRALSGLMDKTEMASDESIEAYLQCADRWIWVLEKISTDPALEGVWAGLRKTCAAVLQAGKGEMSHDPDHIGEDGERTQNAAEDFIHGLKLSVARAEAIHRVEDSLAVSELFSQGWLRDFSLALTRGKLAHDTAVALGEYLDRLEGVLRIREARAALQANLVAALDQLLAQVAEPGEAMAALQQAVLTREITARLRAVPKLQAIDTHQINSSFERYRLLDQQKKMLVREVIAHHWISRQKGRLLNTTGSRLNSAGADLRRRLTSRGERAMRLRQVISIGEQIEGGDPLFDLCPVWMASPETVAQIFPLKSLFDVLVFDEASQCRLEEALPVLTRGQRVVIAGDPHQLPPTRFFESGVVQSSDDEPETDQELFETQQGTVEDLLAGALNLAIQQCYLDVHYRSRNADLIEFSNQNFYSSRLQAIPGHPANWSKFSPVTLYRVDGIYDKRTNPDEAEKVVQIVADLLKRAEPPSIGIACLNLPQRDLITEKLDDLAGEDREFGRRLAVARSRKGQGSFEGLFVKNLENVQGDERDDIIISTTYGPDPKGKFYRRFGPLGMAGGGRRLNVLVTRARCEVHLVTSIPAESYRNLQAIPEGQAATGAWLLFAYLKYAENLATAYANGKLAEQDEGHAGSVRRMGSKAPSLFAEKLADALAAQTHLGSDVHWGNDGFCVDLAMHHPVRSEDVTIGVLCDGCRYGAAPDAVEWDIFRTGILASQGWDLHRIWTPHFFRDPQGNIAQIRKKAAEFVANEKPVDAIATGAVL